MKQESHFNHEERAREQAMQQAGQKRLEFQAAEELIRHDAERITVPPQIIERLKASVEKEELSKPWWRRLFS